MMIARAHPANPQVPSRNSLSSARGVRKRPLRYPPRPKLASDIRSNQSPDKTDNMADVSRQVEDGEATARPSAEPNESSTNETAAATIAPHQIAPQGLLVTSED
jgi:hypothetical protein